jgi:general secretion pathway protein L
MSRTLILLPHPLSETADGFVAITRHGSRLSVSQTTSPRGLPDSGGEVSERIGLVPVQALSWHRVRLPKGTLARGGPQSMHVRAVLQGLLEEHLLQEPQAVHFALQPEPSDAESIWVAACDRAWLRRCLQALELAGKPVHRLIPVAEPEPQSAIGAGAVSQLMLTGRPESPVLVVGSDSGMAALPLMGPDPLQALPESVQQAAQSGVVLLADEALAEGARAWWTGQIKPVEQARRLYKRRQSEWDLAQFEFHLVGGSGPGASWFDRLQDLWAAPAWRTARLGLTALLVVQLVALPAWAWREKRLLAERESALRAQATQVFPQLTVVLDAPLQAARELARLRRNSTALSPQDFEATLAAVVSASEGFDVAWRPQEMRFDVDGLQMRAASLSATDVQAWQRRLEALGYSATEQDGLWRVRFRGPNQDLAEVGS